MAKDVTSEKCLGSSWYQNQKGKRAGIRKRISRHLGCSMQVTVDEWDDDCHDGLVGGVAVAVAVAVADVVAVAVAAAVLLLF